MTQNQINYWNLQELNRSNTAREAETYRSNVAKEKETKRSNVAKEKETNRHNLVTEGQTDQSLKESARHNLATESHATASLEETKRHNLVTSTESQRHNEATEQHAGRVQTEVEAVNDFKKWLDQENLNLRVDEINNQVAKWTQDYLINVANVNIREAEMYIKHYEALVKKYAVDQKREQAYISAMSDLLGKIPGSGSTTTSNKKGKRK